jgi:hypothetical protein
VNLLQRILLSHSRVSEDDDDMATAYVARFTRRILGVVGQASRAASPGVMDGIGSNEEDMGFMAELVSASQCWWEDADGQEQFLQMPDYVVENETKDQEYWYVRTKFSRRGWSAGQWCSLRIQPTTLLQCLIPVSQDSSLSCPYTSLRPECFDEDCYPFFILSIFYYNTFDNIA